MKSKVLLYTIISFIVLTLYSVSVSCQSNEDNYSIKNRWTLKASVSRYKTVFAYGNIFDVGDFWREEENERKLNFKIETNYGVNKFVEIGIYTGFQRYEYEFLNGDTTYLISEDYLDTIYGLSSSLAKSSAPLFGININLHILPFLVDTNICRWDLYLTAKYGGYYFSHKEHYNNNDFIKKYRQEYGLGAGFAYHFRNVMGIFAECCVGQFSLTPLYVEQNFCFRTGISLKF